MALLNNDDMEFISNLLETKIPKAGAVSNAARDEAKVTLLAELSKWLNARYSSANTQETKGFGISVTTRDGDVQKL